MERFSPKANASSPSPTPTTASAARARGRRGGRTASLTPTQVQHARTLYAARTHTGAEIAALLGVARTTV